jgi:hypothetical protein
MSEHSLIHQSLRQEVFQLLNKNPILKPKQICALLNLSYEAQCGTVKQYKKQWRREYKSRQAHKCLSFHNVRGWVVALRSMERELAVTKGWVQTRARNKMLLFKDVGLGRLEWFGTGRVNVWVRKPATVGRVKQLLAKGFLWTGLVGDVEVFELWAASVRFKGAHLVFDTGERLPYARVDYLKDSLGVVAKIGDATHPTCLELEFAYPDWMERNERLFEQFTEFLKALGAFENHVKPDVGFGRV